MPEAPPEKLPPGPSQEVELPGKIGGDTIAQPTTAPADCPDLEDIAALLDGKLAARERARVTEHLAGCESCYEIFAGTTHVLEDSRDEQRVPAAPPHPFERPREAATLRPSVWWAAAALAAVLAATVGLLVFLRGPREAGPSTEQLASLVGRPAERVPFPWGREMRGGKDEASRVPLAREAFRLGVRFLDLRVALERGNRLAASDTLRRLILLLKDMDYPPSKALDTYQDLAKKVPQAVPLPSLLEDASAAEKQASTELLEDPRLVELGRWTEACRLAGASGRTDLFREASTLGVLDRALAPAGKDEDALEREAASHVQAIRDEIAAGHNNPAGLGKRCEGLLNLFDYD